MKKMKKGEKKEKMKKKKGQTFLPPADGETPDPCHLSGPEMISKTFRHSTPSDTKHLRLSVDGRDH